MYIISTFTKHVFIKIWFTNGSFNNPFHKSIGPNIIKSLKYTDMKYVPVLEKLFSVSNTRSTSTNTFLTNSFFGSITTHVTHPEIFPKTTIFWFASYFQFLSHSKLHTSCGNISKLKTDKSILAFSPI